MLATVLLWALNLTVTRYALTHGWHPLAYTALRYSSGALLFATFTFGSERSFRIGGRRDVGLLLAAAVTGVWLNQLAFVYAVKLTNASTVALIIGVTPVFAALGASTSGATRSRWPPRPPGRGTRSWSRRSCAGTRPTASAPSCC